MTNPFSLPPLPIAKGILGKIQMALTIKTMIEDKKKSAEAIKNAAVAMALQKANEIKDKKIQELREKGEVAVSDKTKAIQERKQQATNSVTSAKNFSQRMADVDKNPKIQQLRREEAELGARLTALNADILSDPNPQSKATKLVEYRTLLSKKVNITREILSERSRLLNEIRQGL